MRTPLLFAMIFALAACGSGTGGGGTTNQSGTGGAQACASECCPPSSSPCVGLDETACKAKSACTAVRGVPYGVDGGAEQYIGCSSCIGGGDYETCVVDPAKPDACFQIPEAFVPDGWKEIFECQGCAPTAP